MPTLTLRQPSVRLTLDAPAVALSLGHTVAPNLGIAEIPAQAARAVVASVGVSAGATAPLWPVSGAAGVCSVLVGAGVTVDLPALAASATVAAIGAEGVLGAALPAQSAAATLAGVSVTGGATVALPALSGAATLAPLLAAAGAIVQMPALAAGAPTVPLEMVVKPDPPSLTSPLDDTVVPGDTTDITGSAANDEVGVTLGVWRSQTGDTADAVEVEGYTGTTGVDGTVTINDVPKA